MILEEARTAMLNLAIVSDQVECAVRRASSNYQRETMRILESQLETETLHPLQFIKACNELSRAQSQLQRNQESYKRYQEAQAAQRPPQTNSSTTNYLEFSPTVAI